MRTLKTAHNYLSTIEAEETLQLTLKKKCHIGATKTEGQKLNLQARKNVQCNLSKRI